MQILKQAIYSTANRRESLSLMKQSMEIIEDIREDDYLQKLWKTYLTDNPYVGDLAFSETLKVIELIAEKIAL